MGEEYCEQLKPGDLQVIRGQEVSCGRPSCDFQPFFNVTSFPDGRAIQPAESSVLSVFVASYTSLSSVRGDSSHILFPSTRPPAGPQCPRSPLHPNQRQHIQVGCAPI